MIVYTIWCVFIDLTAACDTGCHKDTCMNNGYCYEHWRYGNFTCDCSESDFSGIRCEKGETVALRLIKIRQKQRNSLVQWLLLFILPVLQWVWFSPSPTRDTFFVTMYYLPAFFFSIFPLSWDFTKLAKSVNWNQMLLFVYIYSLYQFAFYSGPPILVSSPPPILFYHLLITSYFFILLLS